MSPRAGIVAHVTRGTTGDREVRFSRADPIAVGAVRHCGPKTAQWDSRRGVYVLNGSDWPCTRRALERAGVEIRDASPSPAMRRFREAQRDAQRRRDARRWLESPDTLETPGEAS